MVRTVAEVREGYRIHLENKAWHLCRYCKVEAHVLAMMLADDGSHLKGKVGVAFLNTPRQ